MSTCSDCKVQLTKENAYSRGRKSGSLYSYCKDCFNERVKQRWTERKEKAVEHMGGKCQDCGYNKCIAALEFHHLDPSSKEANWNKIRLWEWSKVESELDKCVLLCSNCHRERHHSPLKHCGDAGVL